MSRIYYDLTELYHVTRGKIVFYGVARVVAEIAYEISLLNPDVDFVIFDESQQSYFRVTPQFGASSRNGLVRLDLPSYGIPFRVRSTREHVGPLSRTLHRFGLNSVRGINRLRFRDVDKYMQRIALQSGVLISAARPKIMVEQVEYLAKNAPSVKLQAVLHDVMPLHGYAPNPTRFQKNFRFDNDRIIRHASLVVSVSHATEMDLRDKSEAGLLPLLPESCVVQSAHECRPDGATADIVLPEIPYLLGVGITLGRKNLNVVLDAMDHILATGKQPPLLVIAGAIRARTMQSLSKGRYSHLRKYIQIVGSPTQSNLIKLYQNALALVMASRLEGWGLPLGEALWLGTPVISSSTSSLPEVGRDLAIYFDPDDAHELASIITKFMQDQPFRTGVIDRILASKSTLRTWKIVAVEMLSVAAEQLRFPRT